ncbi:MAG: glycosyl hydrolase family 18 protein [Candidatus Dormibacteraeota bacterium]|nr:glycosyl hydrolase family 18 protein [Candidatus Dormibacteraeota bacterium]
MRRPLLVLLAAALLLLVAGAAAYVATQSGRMGADQRVVVSLGDSRLESGVHGIPPQPTFSVRLGPGRRAADYQASLDGNPVALQDRGAGAASLALQAQAQASVHHLEIWRPGGGARHDDAVALDFHIVDPLELAVGWLSGSEATRAEVTWSRPPADISPLVAALKVAGAEVTSDSSSAIATWSAPRPGQRLQFYLPAGFAAADGGYLAQPWNPGVTVWAAGASIQLSNPPVADATGLRLQAYYIGGASSRQDFARHARQVSVLTPAFYSVDGGGALHGNLDLGTLSIAQQNGVEVQPLVTNQDFDAAGGHQLLANPGLVPPVADQLVAQAKAYGYSGFQLDFENIAAADHELLSAFSNSLAARLKDAGLGYSVAVVPRRAVSSPNGASALYDYPALSQGAAWLTMMAYDQHTRQEDPGPVAGLDWVKEVISFSTIRLDPAKVYLGVPLYSRDFSLQAAPSARSYDETVGLAADSGGTISWRFDIATARAVYVSGGVQHVAWLDSRDSLAAKMAVARQMHLAGVSAWRLGLEDPDSWSLWPSR